MRSFFLTVLTLLAFNRAVHADVFSGRCTEGGSPAKGIRLYVSGVSKPVFTDQNGRYSATVPGPGTYTVTPYPSSSKIVANPLRRMVDVGGAAIGDADFEISRLDTRAAIRGRILDLDGRPVAGVGVQLFGLGSLESDENGIYTLSDIQPARYSVTPLKSGMTFLPAVRSMNLVAGRSARLSFRGLPLSSGPAIRTDLSGIFDSRLRLASGTCPILPESVEGRAVVYQRDRQARLYLPRLGFASFGVNSSGFSGSFRKRKIACVIDGDLSAQYSSADAASVTGSLKVVCLGTEQCNGTFSGTFSRR